MSEPKNASEVRSFLGMAQFSAQFIPNYSEIGTPLRKLTRKSVQWKWEQEEKAAFDQLKTSLSIVLHVKEIEEIILYTVCGLIVLKSVCTVI